MGYKIRVDHSKFERAASEIDNYTRRMEGNMKNANSIVTNMLASWKGSDASAFKNKWDSVNSGDSTYIKMKRSLESYSSFLRNAGYKYRKAQTDAVNRANRLPRW